MGIMKNALRERIRRKDIYVVLVIGILIVMMCMSGAATLSINGVPVTEFSMMMPLVLNVVSVIGGGIAIALSLRTIPCLLYTSWKSWDMENGEARGKENR